SVTKKTLIAAEQDRPDVTRRRAQWTKYRDRILALLPPTAQTCLAASGFLVSANCKAGPHVFALVGYAFGYPS
ncbi:hypothetical protein, partial [Bradyrhizobium sp. th.b2]|uniref:hypothetical protein n=1 Tax=Bradyrhizobium sp. th-b2 TaxID=172088 RepID=UPI00048F2B3C